MTPWTRALSVVGGRRVLVALAAVLLGLAIANPIVSASEGTGPATVLIQFLLIAGPGFVVLFGTLRLRRSEVHPDHYATVAAWTVGAPVVVGALMVVYDLQPTVGIENPAAAVPTLLAVACAGGFAVGRYDASARTRRRELDERNRELEATRAELESTVAELAAANERLEEFAYAVSHDLEEPLRTVSSYLQLIESRADEELSEETREHLEFALDGAERMRQMIEALLTYSRVETEAGPLEPVDLDDVLSAVRETLHDRLERSDATVEVGDLPTVRGDERQLRQVFQNLLDNAVEYSGDEPPYVAVRAEPHEREAGHVTRWRVAVEDRGVGIPPDAGDRVFEVFERAHADDTTGTGIGLALCQRIVDRHGGELWYDSEPGEGTTFYLTLPDGSVEDGDAAG